MNEEKMMNPLELKTHPLNMRIYGHEKPDPDLVKSITEKGILEPLRILKDGTIISGHRRYRAALVCDPVPKVPCVVVSFKDKLEEQEALIEFNRQRVKTFTQLMREADELERIYKAQAKTNSLNNLKQYKTTLKEEFQEDVEEKPDPVKKNPTTAETPKSRNILPKGKKVRDVVGEHIGMSGGTYQRAKKVVAAKKSPDPIVSKVAAEEVEKLDNDKTSISAAHKRVKSVEKKGGRPKGSKVEGLPNGTVRKFVQTRLDTFETPVNQVSERAAQMVREHLESEAMGITLKAAKAAARENRKTIIESDVRRALNEPLR